MHLVYEMEEKEIHGNHETVDDNKGFQEKVPNFHLIQREVNWKRSTLPV
jgi:hypothetical protein